MILGLSFSVTTLRRILGGKTRHDAAEGAGVAMTGMAGGRGGASVGQPAPKPKNWLSNGERCWQQRAYWLRLVVGYVGGMDIASEEFS
jgi:hypothetical protein